jgi:uncharacterized protein YndB with AHSA1/START domain
MVSMNPSQTYGRRTAQGEMTFARLLPGPLERVWEYLTDSAKRGKWLASGEMEGRVGGKIDLQFRQTSFSEGSPPPPEYVHLSEGTLQPGIVTRYEPQELLGFTWGSGETRSEVIVRLTPVDRQIRLVLTHRHLRSPDAEANAAGGWHTHLDLLQAVLEGDTALPYWTELQRLKDEYREILQPG